MSLIIKATRFATQCHAGQVRKYNGSPYILHPMRVAARTSMIIGACEDMVAAAWLHDVIEDCGVRFESIQERFGHSVAVLVGELTNTSKQDYPGLNRAGRKQKDREKIQRIGLPSKTIKLIDRIDNLREMDGCGDDFLDVYKAESRLLLEVLRGTDALLEMELEKLCR